MPEGNTCGSKRSLNDRDVDEHLPKAAMGNNGDVIIFTLPSSTASDDTFPSKSSITQLPTPANTNDGAYGVQIRFLKEIIVDCVGGKALQEDLTVNDVCERIVKPFTKQHQISFCDHLRRSEHGSMIGRATIHIVYGKMMKFLDLVEVLTQHFHANLDTVVWLDVFSSNQHRSATLLDISEAMKSIDRTVVVYHPSLLADTLCHWELYCTSTNNAASKPIELVMGIQEAKSIMDSVELDDGKNWKSFIEVKDVQSDNTGDNPEHVLMRENLMVSLQAKSHSIDNYYHILHTILSIDTFIESLIALYYKLRQTCNNRNNNDSNNEIALLSCRLAGTISMLYYQQPNQYDKAYLYGQLSHKGYKFLLLNEEHSLLLPINKLIYTLLQQYSDKLMNYQQLCQQHLLTCEQLFSNNNTDNTITTTTTNCFDYVLIKYILVLHLYVNCKYYQALPIIESCYNMSKSLYGDNHMNTITIYALMGNCYNVCLRTDEALVIYQYCHNLKQTILGSDHIETLRIQLHLLQLHNNSDNDLMNCIIKLMNKNIQLYGNNSDNVLYTIDLQYQLSTIYIKQQQYTKACELLESCITQYCMIVGNDHTLTLQARFLHIKALSYQIITKEKAFVLAQQLYDDEVRILGENHITTLQTLLFLINIHNNDITTSLQIYEQIYKQAKECYENDDIRINEYAIDFADKIRINPTITDEDAEKAIMILEERYDMNKQLYGNTHRETIQIILLLTDFESLLINNYNKRKQIIQLIHDYYPIVCHVYGKYHNNTITVLKCIASFYSECQENDQALEYYKIIHDTFIVSKGEEDADTLQAMMDHATAKCHIGQWEEGLDMAEIACQLAEAIHGETNDITVICVNQLGKLYLLSLSHRKQGLIFYQQWYERYRSSFGDEDESTLKMLFGIVEGHIALHDHDMALAILMDCYEKQKRVLGEDHPDTILSSIRWEHFQSMNDNEDIEDEMSDVQEAVDTNINGNDLPTDENNNRHDEVVLAVPNNMECSCAEALASGNPNDSLSLKVIMNTILLKYSIPVELRNMIINDYMYDTVMDTTIHQAVELWRDNNDQARLQYGHISTWDTSNITNMEKLFCCHEDFNESLNNWDVSNVTNMDMMFYANSSIFNQPLNNWNVSNVTTMNSMFQGCKQFNQPLNNWNVSNVMNMSYMFHYAEQFNQSLNEWDVSQVNDMSGMFSCANNFNGNISKWNVSNVINMNYIFHRTLEFNQPLNEWNVSNVIDMGGMFFGSCKFNQPINNWNTSNVKQMSWLFDKATSFNQPLNDWDVSNVIDMSEMFNNAGVFNQPLDKWNVGNVTNMKWMFNYAVNFNQPLDSWNIQNVTNMRSMFDGARNFSYKAVLEIKWPLLAKENQKSALFRW